MGQAVAHDLVRGHAALADGIEEARGARRGRGDLVEDVEPAGARPQQLVARVFVRLRLRGRGGRRRRGPGRRRLWARLRRGAGGRPEHGQQQEDLDHAEPSIGPDSVLA